MGLVRRRFNSLVLGFALAVGLCLASVSGGHPVWAGVLGEGFSRCDTHLRSELGSPFLSDIESVSAGLRFAEELDLAGTSLQARHADPGARVILFSNFSGAIGPLARVFRQAHGEPAYIGFDGPTRLIVADGRGGYQVLEGQDVDQHAHGFGMPVGVPEQALSGDLAKFRASDWRRAGVFVGAQAQLTYASGVRVVGKVSMIQTDSQGIVRVIRFVNATVSLGSQMLFLPEWGDFDLLVGPKIINAARMP